MTEQELKQALQANRPEPPRGFDSRSDHQLACLPEKEETHVKKFSGIIAVVAAVLVLGMATALAAGIIGWNRGLEDKLDVTDDIKQAYQDTQLFEAPQISVERNGVTVTLEQCIAEPHAAYLAFRVQGWRPAFSEGGECFEVPAFREADVRVEGMGDDCFIEPLFFDGLDGWGMLADGTAPESYDHLPYLDENGELVYIVSLRCDREDWSFAGRKVSVVLTDLGIDSERYVSGVRVDAEGVWAFEWTLTGSDRTLALENVRLPVGDTGAVLTEVHLSPIYIRMMLDVPRTQRPEDYDGMEGPGFRGLKMKDGAVYDRLAGRGWAGYPDETGDAYRQNWALHRIIDPEQVECLLFSSSWEDEDMIEVPLR